MKELRVIPTSLSRTSYSFSWWMWTGIISDSSRLKRAQQKWSSVYLYIILSRAIPSYLFEQCQNTYEFSSQSTKVSIARPSSPSPYHLATSLGKNLWAKRDVYLACSKEFLEHSKQTLDDQQWSLQCNYLILFVMHVLRLLPTCCSNTQ